MLVSEATEPEPPLETVAERLMEAVRVPITIEGDPAPVVVSASIGSVVDDGSPVDELVRCADIALKKAKMKGLNGHVRFDPEMGEAAEAEALLERDLREALDTELLFLSYLPGVDIETGRVTSAEALLRWRHPERGVIAAREFMPLLEQSGTIVEVGNWVLKEACMQAAAWQRRGMGIALHVNLSARQLGADVLLEELRDILNMSRLNPDLLVLEVAEATVVREPAAMAQRLNEFKALGVNIAMDSFGSAYSNLGQLKQLPARHGRVRPFPGRGPRSGRVGHSARAHPRADRRQPRTKDSRRGRREPRPAPSASKRWLLGQLSAISTPNRSRPMPSTSCSRSSRHTNPRPGPVRIRPWTTSTRKPRTKRPGTRSDDRRGRARHRC